MNPFFPIVAEATGPKWWVWFMGTVVLLLNIALWFVAAIVIAAGVHLGWLLV
jgi:hypothetical protein